VRDCSRYASMCPHIHAHAQVDTLDPFSEGVVFSVRPPKKSWKNICNLVRVLACWCGRGDACDCVVVCCTRAQSGGEKTLSSLALVFALHHYKPAPVRACWC
jgi:structural maintenance of chromosome 4